MPVTTVKHETRALQTILLEARCDLQDIRYRLAKVRQTAPVMKFLAKVDTMAEWLDIAMAAEGMEPVPSAIGDADA